MSQKKKLIGVISLGCDKNRVDTEVMLTKLKDAGYGFTSDPASSDVIIINTCAFIKSAREESEIAISDMLELKNTGKVKKIIVTGCYPQKDKSKLLEDFPGVDAFIGINEYDKIVEIVDGAFKTKETKILVSQEASPCFGIRDRLITTPSYYAYLKIADGCNNFCTYCTIPYIRGRYRSRDIESLVEEAKNLVNNGVREIILVAQDVTKYGIDLYKKPKIVELIRELSKIDDLKWIRLLYCYPEDVTDELIDEIKNNHKVCKYIDIPLQHVSDSILKRMNRKTTKSQIESLIDKLKDGENKISIRTTFMVGFPGETDEDVKTLAEFIKTKRLDYVGFFEYSKEEGTVAGGFENQIDEKTKRKRLIKLAKIQKKSVRNNNKALIGNTYEFVYEGDGVGRLSIEAPEIDSITYVGDSDLQLQVGGFYYATIVKSKGYDFIAKIFN